MWQRIPITCFTFLSQRTSNITSLLQITNIHSLFIDLLFNTFLRQGKYSIIGNFHWPFLLNKSDRGTFTYCTSIVVVFFSCEDNNIFLAWFQIRNCPFSISRSIRGCHIMSKSDTSVREWPRFRKGALSPLFQIQIDNHMDYWIRSRSWWSLVPPHKCFWWWNIATIAGGCHYTTVWMLGLNWWVCLEPSTRFSQALMDPHRPS